VTLPATTAPVLSVRNLSVDARTPEGLKPVLRDISFSLSSGETLCIAGAPEGGGPVGIPSLAGLAVLVGVGRVRLLRDVRAIIVDRRVHVAELLVAQAAILFVQF